MKNKRVARGKVGVAKGFGPRHAENAKEGDLTQVNTDTVPAMLTPREAVLNRNAAEMAGRGNIEKLNQEGNVLAQKGVDLAADGESDVGVEGVLRKYRGGDNLSVEELNALAAFLRSGGAVGQNQVNAPMDVSKFVDVPKEEAPVELPNPNRAKGDTSVAPVRLPKVPRVVASSNVLKYVPEGQIRREVAAAIPKGIAQGDDDVPPNAWSGPSLWERVKSDFGSPTGMADKATKDLMHFLSQFGAPTEKAPDGLGPRISNEEMMRRYPGLQLQEGEDDTPYPMRLPPTGAEGLKQDQEQEHEELLRDLEDRLYRRGVPPLRGLSEGEESKDTGHVLEGYRMLAQKGTSDMKPKKMQGGGNVPPQPYNSIGGGAQPMQTAGAPPQPYGGGMPGAGTGGDPMGGGPMFPGSPAWQRTHPNYQAPAQTPFTGPDFVGSPQWRRTHPNYYGGTPGAGGGGPGLQGGGFYPPGQGFASGTPEVPETIGSPNTQTAYGPPITLSAPTLQRAAVQAGLNPGQIQGLMKAVQGVGQAYNSMGGGGATDVSSGYYGLSQSPGGYQGGISDIGYPPMLMPGAQYHADKGSTWEGPYDPQYLVQRYMRGTGMVPGW